jgi:hypothetical protein
MMSSANWPTGQLATGQMHDAERAGNVPHCSESVFDYARLRDLTSGQLASGQLPAAFLGDHQ